MSARGTIEYCLYSWTFIPHILSGKLSSTQQMEHGWYFIEWSVLVIILSCLFVDGWWWCCCCRRRRLHRRHRPKSRFLKMSEGWGGNIKGSSEKKFVTIFNDDQIFFAESHFLRETLRSRLLSHLAFIWSSAHSTTTITTFKCFCPSGCHP